MFTSSEAKVKLDKIKYLIFSSLYVYFEVTGEELRLGCGQEDLKRHC